MAGLNPGASTFTPGASSGAPNASAPAWHPPQQHHQHHHHHDDGHMQAPAANFLPRPNPGPPTRDHQHNQHNRSHPQGGPPVRHHGGGHGGNNARPPKGGGSVVGGDNSRKPQFDPTGNYILHTVVNGENIWGLSQKYGIAMKEIQAVNPHVRDIDRIFGGEMLKIPRRIPQTQTQPKALPEEKKWRSYLQWLTREELIVLVKSAAAECPELVSDLERRAEQKKSDIGSVSWLGTN